MRHHPSSTSSPQKDILLWHDTVCLPPRRDSSLAGDGFIGQPSHGHICRQPPAMAVVHPFLLLDFRSICCVHEDMDEMEAKGVE